MVQWPSAVGLDHKTLGNGCFQNHPGTALSAEDPVPWARGRLLGFDQSKVGTSPPSPGTVNPLLSTSPSFLGLLKPLGIFSFASLPPSFDLFLFLSVPIKPSWKSKRLVVPHVGRQLGSLIYHGWEFKVVCPFGGQLAISVKDSNGQIHGLSSFSS